ncbi:MAG: AI-2E family transporter [Bacteroidetes bacterium]|nr:AI-2E family transporter [Bacteroidota bacterium]MBL6944135.1 AI-2E family transporter [Bacteroidales bacterium]
MNKEKINEESQIQKSIKTGLRFGFIALLFVMSYLILKPFIGPLIWGIIIAVALFPLHKRFSKALGNKEKLSAIIIVLITIILLVIVPLALFTESTIESVESISKKMEAGTLSIPPPDVAVESWPIIGKPIYHTWKLASHSISSVFVMFEPQLKEFAPKLLLAVTGMASTVFLFIISIIIAGALLINTKTAEKTAISVFKTLAGEGGEHFAPLASATIRSVVKGVLGTAFIQAFFISIGLFVIDFPGAEIVSIIVLFVAIIQLPVVLVLIPVILYVFTYAGTTVAVIFTIWAVFWSFSDNIIKPMLMGRGMDIPMLVILLGVIGGMIMGGIIGLFIGAVLLAFSYKVFQAIIQPD